MWFIRGMWSNVKGQISRFECQSWTNVEVLSFYFNKIDRGWNCGSVSHHKLHGLLHQWFRRGFFLFTIFIFVRIECIQHHCFFIWNNACISHHYRIPFNWKTPSGYFLLVILGTLSMYSTCVSILPSTCLVFGTYWFDQTIVRDIINDYRVLNDKVSDLNQKEVLEVFYRIIDDISDAKQLSDLALSMRRLCVE